MELRRIAVTNKSSKYKEVKDLMKRAFPKNERMPMWLLNYWAKKTVMIFGLTMTEKIFAAFVLQL